MLFQLSTSDFQLSPLLGQIWMPSGTDVAALGPLWVLVGTIVAVLVGALIFGRNWRISGSITIIGAIVTAYLGVTQFKSGSGGPWAGFAPENSAPMLVADQFSNFFLTLLGMFLAAVTLLWFLGQDANLPEDVSRKRDATEFFVLLTGSAFGMALMVSTTNLLMIILAVEMASLPSYGIAGFRKSHRLAAEASLKYVLFGAVTSAIMIYGASLLYGHYGTLDVVRIGSLIASGGGVTVLSGVAIFAVLVGVAFKVSAVPFHFWCPDVFEGATIEVTTWLSVASKAAGLGLMLRIITGLNSAATDPTTMEYISLAVAVMAAITCTVGNLSAYYQTNVKRLLAYSSIAHAGYMLMAVAIIGHPAAHESLASLRTSPDAAHPAYSAIAAYLVIYMFMNLGAFACIAMVYWSTGKETIDAFNGLMWRKTGFAIMLAICLLSLVGIPPFAGFMVKVYLLLAVYHGGLVWLVFVAVFNTLISLYYYMRIIFAMVFKEPGEHTVQAPVLGQAIVALCALVILLAGLPYAGRLKAFSEKSAKGLYAVSPIRQAALAEQPHDAQGVEAAAGESP